MEACLLSFGKSGGTLQQPYAGKSTTIYKSYNLLKDTPEESPAVEETVAGQLKIRNTV